MWPYKVCIDNLELGRKQLPQDQFFFTMFGNGPKVKYVSPKGIYKNDLSTNITICIMSFTLSNSIT